MFNTVLCAIFFLVGLGQIFYSKRASQKLSKVTSSKTAVPTRSIGVGYSIYIGWTITLVFGLMFIFSVLALLGN